MLKTYGNIARIRKCSLNLMVVTILTVVLLPCYSKADASGKSRERAQMENRLAIMKENVSTISLTVFPIVMTEEPYKDVSVVVAIMLERANMEEIDVADEVFLPSTKDDIWQISDSFSTFIRKKSIDTDYALFGEYVGTPQTGVKEIRCIVVDREGKHVWVDRQTPEDEDFQRIKPNNPMLSCYLLVDRLRTALGLPDPEREDAPEGKWVNYSKEESGVPPDSEFSAMEERLAVMRDNFKNAKIVIFPILLEKDVSKESAVNLAGLLNEQEMCHAEVAPQEILLGIEPSRSEPKMLWDLAHKFRNYVRKNKIETDYALYGQYFIFSREIIGIGVTVMQDDTGNFAISRIIEDGPAAEAGLMVQDQIIEIDEQKVEGWTLSEVTNNIRRERGAEVTFKVVRGDKTLDFNIARTEFVHEGVGAVHFIFCDRNGEWVIVDLQNEYQSDFKSISPETALDCGKLVVKRIESYLEKEK